MAARAHPHGDDDIRLLGDEFSELADEKDNLISLDDRSDSGLRHRKHPSNQKRPASSRSLAGQSQSDSRLAPIVAAFVVEFDAKQGNRVQWSRTVDNTVDVRGVEYKALPSGAHTITSDTVTFKLGPFYGLAAFRTETDKSSARGAVFRSCGVLGRRFDDVTGYRTFLQSELSRVYLADDYNALENLVENTGATDLLDGFSTPTVERPVKSESELMQRNRIVRDFCTLLGADIFQLWKTILLRKRILIMGTPPFADLCDIAYLCSLMGNYDISSPLKPDYNLLLYVDLNDIDRLRESATYIACTSELIFQMKNDCYDVLIMKNQLNVQDPVLGRICLTSATDRDNFSDMMHDYNLRSSITHVDSGRFDAARFIGEYFTSLNEKILSAFHAADCTPDRAISDDVLKDLSLNPSCDIPFLQALADMHCHGVRVESKPWCPQCRCC